MDSACGTLSYVAPEVLTLQGTCGLWFAGWSRVKFAVHRVICIDVYDVYDAN